MSFRAPNNRIWVGWLLTLTLLFLTLPSGAAWQCLDGTPCPSNCPMLQGSRFPDVSSKSLTKSSCSHCSHCTSAVSTRVTGLRRDISLSCTSSKCVVRVSEHPASTLQHGLDLPMPLLALPPPAPAHLAFIILKSSFLITFPIRLCFYPQRFLRPVSGRAPPIFL